MHRNRRKSLAVITSLIGRQTGAGRFKLTQKFVEGMQAYARSWDGEVCAYVHPGSVEQGNLDNVEVEAGSVGFDIRSVPFDTSELYSELTGRGVVLGMHHLLPELAQRCLELGVPCVYNPEYTLRTRLQIVRTERNGLLRKLKSSVWELREEARIAKQIRIADGVQCNGLPSYLKYAPLNRAPLLYFDSRVREQALVTDQEIVLANARRLQRQPLHLVFSGRLIRSKGADHLIRVAAALCERQVPFRMTICGDGDLKPSMLAQIEEAGLGATVQLRGVLDFSSALLPFLKSKADLFVCCHRQGDPSCTYVETFASGVPIVGYANEALTSLINASDAGATVAEESPAALAALIAELDRDRARLNQWAYCARTFAAKHTMERTFEHRISHLLGVRNGFLRHGRPNRSQGTLRVTPGTALIV